MMMAASYISYSFWPGKRERILTSWGFKEIKIFNSERHSTNGYWAFHDNFVLLALRGTQEPTDLLTDLSVQLESFEIAGTADSRVHSGFLASMRSIYDKLLEAERFAKQKKVPLIIAGHSLGGAIALLGALKLKNEGGGAAAVWTFGLPKVGNNAFYETARKQLGPQWHHINQTIDPIPTLPFSKHDKPTLLKLAADYGDYLPLLNRFAENAGYWEHNGKKPDDTPQKSESVLQQKFTKIARGFWKHLPRSYVCDLADGSLKVN
jgi:pimeloyl-ACP methyl ester carboxylesterase